MRLLSSPSTVVFILWCTGVGVLTSLIWQEINSLIDLPTYTFTL